MKLNKAYEHLGKTISYVQASKHPKIEFWSSAAAEAEACKFDWQAYLETPLKCAKVTCRMHRNQNRTKCKLKGCRAIAKY